MTTVAVEPEKVAAGIMQFAMNPDVELWGYAAQSFAHGGELVDAGQRKEFRYTNEVVDFCLSIIRPCDEDDPSLCDRYVYLLAAATCFNGPVTAAHRCLNAAAQRAAVREQPEIMPKMLELARPFFQHVSDANTELILYNLGAAAIAAGTTARLNRDPDLARRIFIGIAELVDDDMPDVKAAAYGSLGILHSMAGESKEAFHCLRKAERLLTPLGPDKNLATTYLELGNVLIQEKEWERARRYLEDAIKIVKPLESDSNLTCYPHCLSGLIVVSLMSGSTDYDQLLAWYDIAYKRAVARNDHNLQRRLRDQFDDIQNRKESRSESHESNARTGDAIVPESGERGSGDVQRTTKDQSKTLASISEHLTRRLCVLAGAGVSYDPPSNLPTAQAVLDALLVDLPIADDDRQTLIDAMSPEWPDGIGYFDYLRFEQIIGALEYCGDYHGSFLQSMFHTSRPNENHYQLARLLDAGHTIFTTNFDCLIEQACDELGIPYRVLVTEADYEECIENRSAIENPIFKLHGTALSHRIDSESVSATMQFVTTERTRMASKWKAADNELADSDLLVVGYSGSDDFDVMPSIRFAPGRVAWVLHDSSAPPIVKTMNEDRAPPGIGVDRKLAWFFGRMFGDLSYMGKVKRKPEDIIFARMPTGDALSQFVEPDDRVRYYEPGGEENNTVKTDIRSALPNDPDDPHVLLFVATLFRFVGLYDRAISYLDAAMANLDGSGKPEIELRIHASKARIWLDRDIRTKAVQHMTRALELWGDVDDHQWQDKMDVWEFAYRLDSAAVKDRNSSVRIEVDAELSPRQLAHFRRSGYLWKAEFLLSRKLFKDAIRCLMDFVEDDAFPPELQQQAEQQLLVFKIDRARKWLRVEIGELDTAEWDQKDAINNDLMLSYCTSVFELLQIKDKWADAIFLGAEQDMWYVRPDWSKERLELADVIYRKIGHEYGRKQCAELNEHIEAIRVGATGAVHYRPADRPMADCEGDAMDYCQKCRSLEVFRYQHCSRCAWYSPDAQMSAQDAAADPAARAEFLHKLHMAIGNNFLSDSE